MRKQLWDNSFLDTSDSLNTPANVGQHLGQLTRRAEFLQRLLGSLNRLTSDDENGRGIEVETQTSKDATEDVSV